MNRCLLVLICVTIIVIPSCKKETVVNQPPTKPNLIEPAIGAVVAPEKITFRWEACTDAEGEHVEYSHLISSDSINWEVVETSSRTVRRINNTFIDDGSIFPNYYPFKNGIKYYWKVIATSLNDKSHVTGESESDLVNFYTIPLGVSNLSKTSGDGYAGLTWIDPVGLGRVEITFSPTVISIAQPIEVNPGIGKLELHGLQNETIYSFYVKSFNKLGLASKVDTIKAMPLSPTLVQDADFNIYTTVQIGAQTWMRENLRATKWQNGKPMKNADNSFKYYRIGGKSNIYGYYYLVNAITTYNNSLNPCPCGYHVPSDSDWKTLERFLGMTEADISNNSSNYVRGENEGVANLLKSTTGWGNYNGSNGNGSDLYAFKLLPAGFIDIQNITDTLNVGTSAYLWTSSGSQNINLLRSFRSQYKGLLRSSSGGPFAMSIRCVKNL